MSFTELPKYWKTVGLGEIVRKKSIRALPTEFPDSKFIGMDCIEPNSLRPSFLYEFKDFKSSGNYFEANQVLYGRMRPYLNKVYKAEFEGVCSGEFIVLECLPNFIPDLLKYILHSRDFVRFVNRKTSGDRPRISYDEIIDYPILLPPLAEQQRIVAKLEALFSELDAGLASLNTAAQQLKTYRQAVLKWAFEGKLTNDHVTEGALPAGWKWVKLGELMESVRNGYSKKPDDKGSFPILRISSVRPFKIDLSDLRFLESPLDEINSVAENDLLFTRYNGSRDFVGVCARVPALKETIYYPDKLIRCRPAIKAAAHATYLQYAANIGLSRQFVLSRIKTTAGQTGISGEEIKSIPIPLCSLEEQHRIVQEIESRLSVCDKLEETLAAARKQAEALRQSILKQAFAGKLVAPILNPDGNPA